MSVEQDSVVSGRLTPSSASFEERLAALRGSEWGERLSDEQATALLRYFEAFQAPRGAEVLAEGSGGATLGLLLRGRLRVLKRDFYGVSRSLGDVGASNTFGEMSFFDGHPRSASLVAADDIEVLLLSRERYEAMAAEAPGVALALLEQVTRSLSEALRRVSDRSVQHLL